MDVYYLYKGDRRAIQDGFVQRFESFEKYSAYAKKVGDFDILGKCQIVRAFGHTTGNYVNRIR